MKTQKYQSKSGRTLHKPIIETEDEMFIVNDTDEGFCLACGNTQMGCEPDARRYECEGCGEHLVFGLQELLLMGLLQFDMEE